MNNLQKRASGHVRKIGQRGITTMEIVILLAVAAVIIVALNEFFNNKIWAWLTQTITTIIGQKPPGG